MLGPNTILRKVLHEEVSELSSGIFIPKSEIAAERIGVSKQFSENAETYHEKYFDTDTTESMLRVGLSDYVDFNSKLSVLDVGSGSGNSVIAALGLFPRATIVATDISPNLLLILQRMLAKRPDWRDRVVCVCTDATRQHFKQGIFDLVIGSSILHHLLEPKLVLKYLVSTVKPEGALYFSEPFEIGHSILRLAYKRILDFNRQNGFTLPSEVEGFLVAMIKDTEARRGFHEKEYTKCLDDKWLFTKGFFEDIVSEVGISSLAIRTAHHPESPFSTEVEIQLRVCGIQAEQMPQWAWEIITEYDHAFSIEVRNEILLFGIVTMRKGGVPS